MGDVLAAGGRDRVDRHDAVRATSRRCAQTNLKRILAYSSVGHAGYLLMAIVSGAAGAKALLFYLAVYAVTSVGSFTVIAIRERETGEPATLESLRGWGFSRPILGAALAIFLLSLGGFPPTAGFLAKFYLFAAAINAGYTYLDDRRRRRRP